VPTAPVAAGDSARVEKRINQLFGQRMAAEERNSQYEQQIADLQSQVAALQRPTLPAPAAPQPVPYDPYGTAEQAPQPAGDYVSRAEITNLFRQQTQALGSVIQTQNAQNASRAVAEREFPDVFNDPDLRQAAANLLQNDPALQMDPQGPMKAALMVRGARELESEPAVSGVPATVRKPLLSGVGPSVPQGTPNINDLHAQYAAAINRAAASQDDADFVEARAIQRQILAAQ
jgi:hypothetical protein